MKSTKSNTFFIWAFLLGVLLFFVYSNGKNDSQQSESQVVYETSEQFLNDLDKDQIIALHHDVSTGDLYVYTKTDGYYRTDDIREFLDENQRKKLANIHIGSFASRGYETQASQSDTGWTKYLIIAGLFLALLFFFLKRAGGAQGNILSLRKSRARVFDDYNKVTFEDVGGCAEAKEELGDVIDFLRNPERWKNAGARLPRGILLEGPPGCGKTLLARAVAGEASAKFFLVSASEFVEMFVGVGAARVRDMFEQAVKEAPAIVFIDELDAVGRRRGSGIGAANDEREQTLNQLLVSMDGFESNDQVVVLAATNRADILDKALVRPGRFDRRLVIPFPSHQDRIGILEIHCEQIPLSPDVSLDALARKTDGLNGAQLENLVNEAAMLAVRRARYENQARSEVLMRDFDSVLTKKKEAGLLFDQLDSVLIESVTQLAEPTGRAVVRIQLIDGTEIEGEVAWMDSAMVKLKSPAGGDLIVAKNQIAKIEALAGTERASLDDLKPDTWLSRSPDLA